MTLGRWLGAKVLAGALALTMIPAALPAQAPLVGISQAQADPFYRGYGRGYYGGGPRYYRGGYGYRGGPRGYYGGGRGYYRGDRYYGHRRRGSAGPAIAGAIVGLGVGAAIASANQPRYYAAPAYGPRPWTREWYNYCASRYRSFDARSGTFQPYNGPRQVCR